MGGKAGLRALGRLHASRLHDPLGFRRGSDRLPLPRQPLRSRRQRHPRPGAAPAALARGDVRRGGVSSSTPASWCPPESWSRHEGIDDGNALAQNPRDSVYRSIVRHGVADTNLNRSLIVFENLFLHVHPVKVREDPPVPAHLLARRHRGRLLGHSRRDRRAADVLLPPLGAARLPRHEGAAVRGGQRAVPAQPPPLGRARDGLRGGSPHAPRLLPPRLPAAAPVQLGHRRRPADGDPAALLHRLSPALGPARLSGASRSARTWRRRRR